MEQETHSNSGDINNKNVQKEKVVETLKIFTILT